MTSFIVEGGEENAFDLSIYFVCYEHHFKLSNWGVKLVNWGVKLVNEVLQWHCQNQFFCRSPTDQSFIKSARRLMRDFPVEESANCCTTNPSKMNDVTVAKRTLCCSFDEEKRNKRVTCTKKLVSYANELVYVQLHGPNKGCRLSQAPLR